MSQLEERLVARWSPYALNAGAVLILGLWLVIGPAGLALLPTFALGVLVIPLFAALGASFWLALIGLCPCCNKSPMSAQIGQGKLAKFLRLRRPWPERRCSSCGCDLTVIPE